MPADLAAAQDPRPTRARNAITWQVARMGAVLVCLGSDASNADATDDHTLHGASLLDRLQTSWSCRALDKKEEDKDDSVK